MADYNSSICCIFNIGTHYRNPIYSKMSSELPCDFYFGDRLLTPIKKMDYTQLNHFRSELHNKYLFSQFYWQSKSVRLVFKPYTYYVLDGEPYCLSSWVILFWAKLLNKRTVAWTHGWYGRESIVKKVIKKLFYSLFSELMVYGEYAISLMSKEGFDKSKMVCIANSLDYDNQLKIRLNLSPSSIYSTHFSNSYPVLFYIGRVQKSKKLEYIIQAMDILKQKGFPVNLVVVGKDVDGVHLDCEIAKYNLGSHVWLYGPCYDEMRIGEMFYNADVCVSPGNVGLTAIHSLTYGCPVITHNNFPFQGPEFESIIQGKTGDFFQENDVNSLADTIQKWLSQNLHSREAIRQFAYQTIDTKWNLYYQMNILKQVFLKQAKGE